VSGSAPAHLIVGSFESPIPLWAFVLAAGATILYTALRRPPRRADAASPAPAQPHRPAVRRYLPAPIARSLAVLGPVGIAWVLAQGLLGGSSAGRVDVLFLWHVGWVLLPVLAALGVALYPLVDPWRRLAILLRPRAPRGLPAGEVEPAASGVAAVAAIVWLELVWTGGRGGPALLAALLLHGAWVVAGRLAADDPERWAAAHDPLTIVNRFLGVLASRAPVGDPDRAEAADHIGDRGSASGPQFALAVLLVGAVVYDGLSQTEVWFRAFGLPAAPARAALLAGVAGLVGAIAYLVVGRGGPSRSGARALVVAGLRPVALGYLVAHYGPSLVSAAPHWLVAVADPFQRGWNLFGLAYAATGTQLLPGLLVWVVQVGAVVAGHVAGIRAAERAAPDGAARLPAAAFLVGLTMLTLWTLGQAVVTAP